VNTPLGGSKYPHTTVRAAHIARFSRVFLKEDFLVHGEFDADTGDWA
jgi:hypothetical protein